MNIEMISYLTSIIGSKIGITFIHYPIRSTSIMPITIDTLKKQLDEAIFEKNKKNYFSAIEKYAAIIEDCKAASNAEKKQSKPYILLTEILLISYLDIAFCYQEQEDPTKEKENYQNIIDACMSGLVQHKDSIDLTQMLAKSYHRIASCHQDEEDFAKEKENLQNAIDLCKSSLEQHKNVVFLKETLVDSYLQIACCYRSENDSAKEKENLQNAIDLCKSSLEQYKDFAFLKKDLAYSYKRMGAYYKEYLEPEEARQCLIDSIKLELGAKPKNQIIYDGLHDSYAGLAELSVFTDALFYEFAFHCLSSTYEWPWQPDAKNSVINNSINKVYHAVSSNSSQTSVTLLQQFCEFMEMILAEHKNIAFPNKPLQAYLSNPIKVEAIKQLLSSAKKNRIQPLQELAAHSNTTVALLKKINNLESEVIALKKQQVNFSQNNLLQNNRKEETPLGKRKWGFFGVKSRKAAKKEKTDFANEGATTDMQVVSLLKQTMS